MTTVEYRTLTKHTRDLMQDYAAVAEQSKTQQEKLMCSFYAHGVFRLWERATGNSWRSEDYRELSQLDLEIGHYESD